jgi:hypothetical protein
MRAPETPRAKKARGNEEHDGEKYLSLEWLDDTDLSLCGP